MTVAFSASAAFAGCSDDVAELRWDGGSARFRVEIADSPEERARGLMYRESMSSGAGMLFVFDRPREVGFWMKNTLIPLDMLFVEPDGRVAKVHENAIPHDETLIPGGANIAYVLEINGGLARRLGISEGAELRHPAMDQGRALWPCAGQ
ncbi:DUF192 domain-containing protein [Defluviimonas sp. WL0075]|uniref:DUF192 domain-containing protein n=1 Tax=Albidovulum sediminicola TaxID=2984331 RepID=A0ABT2Z0L5_9RHOB|nr:DUF192 domain-containing protein [Defluviimonas sp. WL0075]MCV2864688.1 DUF192 domain-containing protein [Defluviimonas sp. WL0075]